MQPGSVIVDLAAETGGNCELTEPGETVVRDGVTIVGTANLPATMPLHASQMYARNVQTLLLHLVKDGQLVLDFEDEITRRARLRWRRDEASAPGRRSLHERDDLIVVPDDLRRCRVFVGFEVISKVPTLLHTPLMSGTNAIHGHRPVGAMIVAGHDRRDASTQVARLRRGRLRHDQRRRRLRRHRPHARDVQDASRASAGSRVTASIAISQTSSTSSTWSRRSASSSASSASAHPATARRGNLLARGRAWRSPSSRTLRSPQGSWTYWLDRRSASRSARSSASSRRAHGEDDRDAADGGAVQRRRRRRGGARSPPPSSTRCAPRSASRPAASTLVRDHVRRRLIGAVTLLGQHGRVREAAGADDAAGPITFPGQQVVNARHRARRSRSLFAIVVLATEAGDLARARCSSGRARCSACCSCCRSAAPTCRS